MRRSQFTPTILKRIWAERAAHEHDDTCGLGKTRDDQDGKQPTRRCDADLVDARQRRTLNLQNHGMIVPLVRHFILAIIKQPMFGVKVYKTSILMLLEIYQLMEEK